MIFGKEKSLPSTVHSRLLRWGLTLSGYSYKIIHTKNVKVLDCLSRLPMSVPTEDHIESEQYVLWINESSKQLPKIQGRIQEDNDLKNNWEKNGWPTNLPQLLQNVVYKSEINLRYIICGAKPLSSARERVF